MSKGVPALIDGGWSEDEAYRWGTIMFFGGMFATGLLDLVVHGVSYIAGHNDNVDATTVPEVKGISGSASQKTISSMEEGKAVARTDTSSETSGSDIADPVDQVHSRTTHPVIKLQTADESGLRSVRPPESVFKLSSGQPFQPSHVPLVPWHAMLQDAPVHLAHTPDDIDPEAAKTIDTYVTADHHRFGLQKMGLLTALAIGIHNLPEGLATFIAALSDPLNGVAIAVAIALHNIPEGVCVAMPVYYATGSRWKGFLWAFLSGISEPIGGLLAYAVLYGNRMSETAYGVLFCIVGGMMVRGCRLFSPEALLPHVFYW